MKQLMSYQVELSDENDPKVGRFTIGLLLLVPEDRIATDIVTGGADLLAEDRQKIEEIINDNYKVKNGRQPLIEINEYLEEILPILENYLKNHAIELDSLTVDLFLDLYEKTKIKN